MALLMAAQRSSPVVVDVMIRSIEWIAGAPLFLLFVIVLLVATAGAGAWATVIGIKQGKRSRTRISRRRHRA
jgi:hypothetical protein